MSLNNCVLQILRLADVILQNKNNNLIDIFNLSSELDSIQQIYLESVNLENRNRHFDNLEEFNWNNIIQFPKFII